MNIRELNLRLALPEQGPPMFELVECDGPELAKVLARINAGGDRVTSVKVRGTAHYVLNVRKGGHAQ